MTKELARYFFTLIDRDLYFSFDRMGLPNSACEWLENQLMQENFDKVEEFIKLRYTEQSEKAIKKKRKFRAMTKGEWCDPKKVPKKYILVDVTNDEEYAKKRFCCNKCKQVYEEGER